MKTYEFKPTKHPDLFRVVDRAGNWQHYFHKPSGLYLRGVTTVLDRGYAKGQGFKEFLLSKTKDEQVKILKEAGEFGDRLHRAIDLILSNDGPLDFNREIGIFDKESNDYIKLDTDPENDEWGALISFWNFFTRHNALVIDSEMPLFNLKHRYAGTGDSLMILRKDCGVAQCQCHQIVGQLGLWDWKTSSGIYGSYLSQEAAYDKADNMGDYVPQGLKVGYTAILRIGTAHITTGGYQMRVNYRKLPKNFKNGESDPARRKTLYTIEKAFKRFLAALDIEEFDYKPFDPDDIQEIPDVLHFNINRYSEKLGGKGKAIAIKTIGDAKKIMKTAVKSGGRKTKKEHGNNKKSGGKAANKKAARPRSKRKGSKDRKGIDR